MLIYINGRFLEEPISGVGKYALCLIKEMDKLSIGDNIILLVSKKIAYRDLQFKNIKIKKVGCFSGNVWEQLELPFYSSDGFLLSFCNRGPMFKKNQLLTIHDAATVITPDRFSFKFRMFTRVIYLLLKRRAKVITTVSEHAKADIIKCFNINSDDIHVVHNGICKGVPDETIIDRLNLRHGSYILSVGGTENKNIESIIAALEYLNDDVKYVCVGNLCDKYKMIVRNNPRIIYPGYVNDFELLALYKNAKCFVFPSFYEGFGIPPLEAMSVGCPVVVSNLPVFRELYKDSALYCDPMNFHDLVDKILSLNNELSQRLIKKGYKCSEKYSWKDSAIKILRIIGENV